MAHMSDGKGAIFRGLYRGVLWGMLRGDTRSLDCSLYRDIVDNGFRLWAYRGTKVYIGTFRCI